MQSRPDKAKPSTSRLCPQPCVIAMRGLDGMWWKMRWQEFPASLARPVRVILQQNVLQQEIELGPWEFEKHQFVFVATNPETDPSRQQSVLQQEIELGPWEFEKQLFVFVATNPETDPSRQQNVLQQEIELGPWEFEK